MSDWRLMTGLLLLAGLLALLAPLVANQQPLVLAVIPEDYYRSRYEELRAAWSSEGTDVRQVLADLKPTLLELAALAGAGSRDRVQRLLEQPLDANSPALLEQLLKPRPGLLPRRWFFPAFAAFSRLEIALAGMLAAAAMLLLTGGLKAWKPRLALCLLPALLAPALLAWFQHQSGPIGLSGAVAPDSPQVMLSISAPIPYSPQTIDLSAKFASPSGKHWLGTDSLGRDLFSRLLWGARVSLAVGVLALAAQLSLGILLGGLAGMGTHWSSALFSRGIDGLVSIPGMLMALALLALTGPSFSGVVATVALAGCAPVAQMFRAEVVRLRDSDFIHAAEMLGLGRTRIFLSHLAPNALAPVLAHAGYGVAAAILLESGLSFLGLGVQIPVPSWGGILAEARGQLRLWWLALFPGICILTTVLLAQRLADRTQAALAVKPRQL